MPNQLRKPSDVLTVDPDPVDLAELNEGRQAGRDWTTGATLRELGDYEAASASAAMAALESGDPWEIGFVQGVTDYLAYLRTPGSVLPRTLRATAA
jgi:hypothetical protein